MNKKFLMIFLVAAFLVASLGVISAANDSDCISVKIVWDDNVKDIPDSVTVNLMKDGKVVDSAKLSEKNSWKVNFTVDEDGNYQVQEVISSDYSININGNAQKGFIITNALIENDVLGAGDDETPLEDASDNDQLADDNESELIGANNDTATGANNGTGNGTNGTAGGANNATGNGTDNSTDTNSTIPDDNEDSDDNSDDKTTTKTTTTTKTVVKKVPKEVKKKPADTEKLKKTGFPLVVLIIAIIVAIFIPFARKR